MCRYYIMILILFPFWFMIQNIFRCLFVFLKSSLVKHIFMSCAWHVCYTYMWIYILWVLYIHVGIPGANWGFAHPQSLRGPLFHSWGEGQRTSLGLFSLYLVLIPECGLYFLWVRTLLRWTHGRLMVGPVLLMTCCPGLSLSLLPRASHLILCTWIENF